MEKNLGEPTTRKKEKEGYSYVLPCSKTNKEKSNLRFKLYWDLLKYVSWVYIYPTSSSLPQTLKIKQVHICQKIRHPSLPTAHRPKHILRRPWARCIRIRAGRQRTKRKKCPLWTKFSKLKKTIVTILPSSGWWPTHTAKTELSTAFQILLS